MSTIQIIFLVIMGILTIYTISKLFHEWKEDRKEKNLGLEKENEKIFDLLRRLKDKCGENRAIVDELLEYLDLESYEVGSIMTGHHLKIRKKNPLKFEFIDGKWVVKNKEGK